MRSIATKKNKAHVIAESINHDDHRERCNCCRVPLCYLRDEVLDDRRDLLPFLLWRHDLQLHLGPFDRHRFPQQPNDLKGLLLGRPVRLNGEMNVFHRLEIRHIYIGGEKKYDKFISNHSTHTLSYTQTHNN